VGYPALFTVETNGETGALGMQCLYFAAFFWIMHCSIVRRTIFSFSFPVFMPLYLP
jgi:hypothetical protein